MDKGKKADKGRNPQSGKLTIVTDQQGRVVGAAMGDEAGDMRIGMVALEGQSLHEVDLPADLTGRLSAETLSAAMDGAFLDASGKLKIRRLKMEK